MGDPAGRLKDKADLLRHHLPKTISTSRRETRAGETIAQRGENTGDPELKSLFRQDIFGPKNREKTTAVSPALLDSGLERQLLKFVIAEHNAKVGVPLAKRQVDGTSFTLETEAGAFLLVMLQKRFQQTRFGSPTKAINNNSLSITDRHTQVREGGDDEAHVRQHPGDVIR
eukprot:s2566_g2.t1